MTDPIKPIKPIKPLHGAHRDINAPLLIIGGGLAFATSGPLSSYASPAHPLIIVCGRTLLAAVVLLFIELAVGGRGSLREPIRKLTGRQRAGIALAGLILATHFSLFVWGLRSTSLPAAFTLISFEPLSVVLWAFFLHGVRPARLEQIGLAIATAGGVLIGSAGGAGKHRLSGDLLVVGAAALYGLYLSVARSLRDALPARQYAALVYGTCALFSGALLYIVPGGPNVMTWPIPIHSALAICALALIPTLIGHTAVQAAVRHASPALVALVSPGETVGSLVIGALFLAALPTPREWIGAAIILSGVLVALLAAPITKAGNKAELA